MNLPWSQQDAEEESEQRMRDYSAGRGDIDRSLRVGSQPEPADSKLSFVQVVSRVSGWRSPERFRRAWVIG